MKKKVIILGATGSIGQSTLQVVRNLADELQVVALAANANWERLADQAREFRVPTVGLCDQQAARSLEEAVDGWEAPPKVHSGREGLVRLVRETDADIVLGAISGSAGLPAVLAGLETGKDLALANKEALVMAGNIVMRQARELQRTILPVDSEHSAIFQSLQAGQPAEVRRVVLTASGGPFRRFAKEEMASITPQEALCHPTWRMGAKITIDSATLMNKALEIIEARWLFDLPAEKIQVLIHPQSIIHSMVEYVDGSTVCQLGPPDMKIPIQYALTFPRRRPLPETDIDLADVGQLTFEAPDPERFPSIRLAYEVLERGGTAATVFNAANEVAVELFLKGKLEFLLIFELIERVLDVHTPRTNPNLEEILEADRWARNEVQNML